MNANENEKQFAPAYIFFGQPSLVPWQLSLTEQQATALKYEATADSQPAQFQDS